MASFEAMGGSRLNQLGKKTVPAHSTQTKLANAVDPCQKDSLLVIRTDWFAGLWAIALIDQVNFADFGSFLILNSE